MNKVKLLVFTALISLNLQVYPSSNDFHRLTFQQNAEEALWHFCLGLCVSPIEQCIEKLAGRELKGAQAKLLTVSLLFAIYAKGSQWTKNYLASFAWLCGHADYFKQENFLKAILFMLIGYRYSANLNLNV